MESTGVSRAVADLTWPEYAAQIARSPLVILPVGALEQHGLHLPLDTDTAIAGLLAERVAAVVDGLVLPPVAYGARSLARSGGGARFPGTVDLSGTTLSAIIEDIVAEQSRHGVRQIVLLLGHGENDPFAIEGSELAFRRSRLGETRVLIIGWWQVVTDADVAPLFPEGFPGWDREHAARVETALMLALAPERVRLPAMTAIDPIVAAPYTVVPTPDGAVPSQGSLADPRGATAETGQYLVDLIVSRLVAAIAETMRPPARGGVQQTSP